MKNLANVLSFLLGLTGSMPIIYIVINQIEISAFSIVYILFLFALIFNFKQPIIRIKLNYYSSIFILWLLISILSTLFGLIYFNFDELWINSTLKYIPKVFIYLVTIYFLLKNKYSSSLINLFFSGFLSGCIINLIWSILEGYLFYQYDIHLNNILFFNFLESRSNEIESLTIIKNGVIRASGLNYDPAHLGGIIPIVFIYSLIKKNFILLFLAILSLIFSASTTALLSSILVLLFSISILFKSYNLSLNFNPLKFTLVISTCILIVFIVNDAELFGGLSNNLYGFIERVLETYLNADNKGAREIYHTYLFEAISSNPLIFIFGTGFGSSSYSFLYNPEINALLSEEFRPYDVESTYISYLFDTGIIGLILYLFTLFQLIRYFIVNVEKNNSNALIYSCILGIFFSGIFYHYILSAYQILIIIFSIAHLSLLSQERLESIVS